MTWHPYERHRRLWTVYWGVRSPANATSFSSKDVVEFEMTDPYALTRDFWRNLQLDFITEITPPDFYLYINQLWSRLWPSDGALRFTKLNDIYKVPVLLSGKLDRDVQPGKREPFYWVMTQLQLDRPRLEDVVWFQNIDFENVTWLTPEPIEPWPSQIFELNAAAYAKISHLLPAEDFDQVVRKECWGVLITHMGHLDFQTTRAHLEPEQIMEKIQKLAESYSLEVEFIPFSERPRKPNLLKSLTSVLRR